MVDLEGGKGVRFEISISIDRHPHDVFEFLSHFENVPRWNYAIAETRKTTDGPVSVGTVVRQTRSVPSPAEETLEVIEFEPDRRLAIRGGLGPFEGTLTYDLEQVDRGTRLTNSADLEGRGLMRVAAPLATSRVRESVAANLQKLKEILEA